MQRSQKNSQGYRIQFKNINQQIRYTGQYLTNKPVFTQMPKSRNKKKFRQEHQTEIELYEAAVKFLKEENADGKIPSMKSLKEEKEKLTAAKIIPSLNFNRPISAEI